LDVSCPVNNSTGKASRKKKKAIMAAVASMMERIRVNEIGRGILKKNRRIKEMISRTLEDRM